MDRSVLEFKDVHKEYDDAEMKLIALSEVNFKVQKNSLNMITGPAGSGKTTLFHLIILMDLPTTGDIFLNNEAVLDLSLSKRSVLRREKIGTMLRWGNLMPYLTALENIMLPMINKNDQKAIQVMELLEFSEKKDMLPNGLTHFDKQKTALARALVNEPSLIVADEPFGDLNNEKTIKLMELFHKIKNETSIIILSDDNDSNFDKYLDSSFILENGKLIKINKKINGIH
ncbi:MAG: ATP-binding cassette domain-containing protein [Methanobacteriaceae archaeon]|nr:ATP-binding cassette domain-containing protein [Methanobacteriaceae archaeon]MDO9628040.1 ATP-binding cassette domain-containing protein [Methanobacteriaceae archaeon]